MLRGIQRDTEQRDTERYRGIQRYRRLLRDIEKCREKNRFKETRGYRRRQREAKETEEIMSI